MTVETYLGRITATKDTLRMLAHYMDRAALYYEGHDCLASRAIARECSLEIYKALGEYCNK
jgi:hypothetical protein